MPTLHQKRQIDSLVGIPLCAMLGVLTRIAGVFARGDHSLRDAPRRVLVVKLVGQGSIINATHLLRAAKEQWPGVEVHFVGLREIEPLVERLPDVDRLHILDDRSYVRLLFSTLRFLIVARRLRFDLVVDLELHSKCSTALSTLTGASNRAGYFLDTTLFRRALYTHLVFYNRLQHLQQAYLHIGRALGLEPHAGRPLPPSVNDDERAAVADRLTQWGLGERRLLLINVNAGELCLERRWMADRFARVASLFAARGDTKVVLVGAPFEAHYVESVRALVDENVRDNVVNAAGELAYGEFLALMAAADVLLTGDTGPMHLAAALGTRTVSLWGPTLPQVYRPPGDDHRAIYHGVYCSPCVGWAPWPPCGGRNACMEMISVDEVARTVGEALGVCLNGRSVAEHSPGAGQMQDHPEPDGEPGLAVETPDGGRTRG